MSMYNIQYLHLFYIDLNTTIDYISNVLCNPDAANNLYEETINKINDIRKNPFVFRIYDGNENFKYEFRKAKVKNYYIFFYVDEDTVRIVRFVYSMRDIDNLLDII